MFQSWHIKYVLLMSSLFTITVGYNACTRDAEFDLIDGVSSLPEFSAPAAPPEEFVEPQPKVVINNGAEFTTEAVVNLELDPDGLADKMLISEASDCSVGDWEPYQQNKLYELQALNQEAIVYVQYRFQDQHPTKCVSDSIFHDDIPPAINFAQGVGSGWLNQDDISLAYEVTDTGGGVKEIQCDRGGSGNYQSCGSSVTYINLSEDRSYSLVVRAVDRAGNMADPQQLNWRVDVTVPTVVFNSTPAAITADQTPDFAFVGNDLGSGITGYECKLDNGEFVPCTSPMTLSNLADGSHTYTVRATDGVGLVSEEVSYTWVQDTMAPTIAFTATPEAISNSNSARFEFQVVAGDLRRFECRLDQGAYADCTSPEMLANLGDGNHSISVIGYDQAENASAPITYNWLVDTMRPTISFVETPNPIESSANARFSFLAQDGGSGINRIECRLGNSPFGPCETTMNFSNIAEGNNTLQARSVDQVGNLSDVISYTWVVDLTAPMVQILSQPVNPTSETTAEFSFTATDSGSDVDRIECRVDGMPFAACTSPTAFSDIADGDHTFAVRAYDGAGNQSMAVTYEWVVDTTAPEISFIAQPNPVEYVGANPKINFVASDGNGVGVATHTCIFNNTPMSSCLPNTAYDFPAEQEGSNSFMVTATDLLGNSATATLNWQVQFVVSEHSTNFQVLGNRPVDILVIVDNSGSMDEERANLGARILGLIDKVVDLDWQLAVTTTGATGSLDYQAGRIVDFDGNGRHILDSTMDTAEVKRLFENKVNLKSKSNPFGIPGFGDGNERGILTMSQVIDRALDPNGDNENNQRNADFIRDEADFVAIVLSDENEASEGKAKNVTYQPLEFLDRFNRQFNNSKKFTFHSIVVMSGDQECLTADEHHHYGTLYEDLSKLTGYGQPGGGTIGSVCDTDYTNQLATIGESVKDLSKTVSLKCAPVDADQDGSPDIVMEFKVMGAADYAPFSAAYNLSGQQIAFADFLPVGDFKFQYKCAGEVGN